MKIELYEGPLTGVAAETLVVFAFEDEQDAAMDKATGGLIAELYASQEFSGKPFESAILHRPSGLKAKRLVLAGAGKRADFDQAQMRKACGAIVRTLKNKSLQDLHLAVDGFAQAAVEGAILGDYDPDQRKSDPEKQCKRLASVTVCVEKKEARHDAGPLDARIVAESQNFSRVLKNEPANQLTPLVLVERAREMASEVGLECEVLDEARMRQLGMGALLGVSQGSENPGALIVLRYVPEGDAGADHLGLIGKGVTFDTGGVSIKPADGMEKMKYDMGGGAAVLGAMRALAQLKPPVRVTALIPTVENMVSGRAQRPGDIVTSLSGKTVEVINTDAEGRMILIDAITYAIRLGCTHMVDAATLTGAIVVALGNVHVGAFTNNDEMLARVTAASRLAGERMWHMPLDDDYKDYLKNPFADLGNVGGRWGGACSAAKFIEEFVEGKPWVHLDIAGTAWLDEGKPWMAKGPSGVAVRTFVELAMNWTQ